MRKLFPKLIHYCFIDLKPTQIKFAEFRASRKRHESAFRYLCRGKVEHG